ncbi:MAG: MFS transporter [Sulfolobales archaeon]|nr:MFS transporter [Sulfolobales archaeon]
MGGSLSISYRRAVISAAIGNAVEWYDFAVYGYLATIIASLYFPSKDPLASLALAFLAFAVGFVARPIGAIVIGHYGDKYGRRNALILTVSLMSIGTILLGMLPTYNDIGVLAPIGVAIARLIQGFSAGGEWGGSTAFMVEYAPQGRRGYIGSWQQFTVGSGFLLGSLAATIITYTLPGEALRSWGWRLPFVVGGAVVGLVGLYLRLGVPETPKFKEIEARGDKSRAPLIDAVRNNYREIAMALGFTIIWTVAYYMFLTYMPSYASAVLKIPPQLSFLSSTISLALFLAMIPVFGRLSDTYGRKPFLIASTIGLLILTYPLLYVSAYGFEYLLVSQIIIALLIAMFSGPGPAAIAELFPTKVRYSGLSIGYNIAVTGFGGTAPYIATMIIAVTGNRLLPSLYVMAAAIATLVTLLNMRETAREALK